MAKQNDTQIIEPMNLEAAMNLLRTTDECLRCYDAEKNVDFYVTKDVVNRRVFKNGKRVNVAVEKWTGFDKYGEQHNISISDLGSTIWYLMNFDEEGNPIWTAPITSDESSEVAVA